MANRTRSVLESGETTNDEGVSLDWRIECRQTPTGQSTIVLVFRAAGREFRHEQPSVQAARRAALALL